jgi:hypothetical protein
VIFTTADADSSTNSDMLSGNADSKKLDDRISKNKKN